MLLVIQLEKVPFDGVIFMLLVPFFTTISHTSASLAKTSDISSMLIYILAMALIEPSAIFILTDVL